MVPAIPKIACTGTRIVTTISEAGVDNRRLTLRIVSAETVRTISAMSSAHGGDVIRYMVFAAIWTANSGHLTSPDRYAELYDIPPDSQRRPVSESAVRETLGIPSEIFDSYLADLIAEGSVERASGGLFVPAAVFTRPEQLANANEFYARFVTLITRLRSAGFRFGDSD